MLISSTPTPRHALRQPALRTVFGASLFLAAGFASFDASAGYLDKLLAPAVGTKPGFSEGKKTYDEDTLKPEELKTCVIKAHDIDERAEQKTGDTENLAKQKEELSVLATSIKEAIEAAKKDAISEEQAKKLNDRVAEYKAKEAAFNAAVDAANSRSKAHAAAQNADLEQFRDLCAGRRFYKSDLESVRPTLPFDISGILAGKK
jgi:hypothetical protein